MQAETECTYTDNDVIIHAVSIDNQHVYDLIINRETFNHSLYVNDNDRECVYSGPKSGLPLPIDHTMQECDFRFFMTDSDLCIGDCMETGIWSVYIFESEETLFEGNKEAVCQYLLEYYPLLDFRYFYEA